MYWDILLLVHSSWYTGCTHPEPQPHCCLLAVFIATNTKYSRIPVFYTYEYDLRCRYVSFAVSDHNLSNTLPFLTTFLKSYCCIQMEARLWLRVVCPAVAETTHESITWLNAAMASAAG